MKPRSGMLLAVLLAHPLAFGASAGAGAAERVPLDVVVQELAAQGIVVVFSAALIESDAELDLAALTPEAVDAALRPLGLTLVHDGPYWLIAPLEEPRGVRLRLRSRSGARVYYATLGTPDGITTVIVAEDGTIDRVLPLGAELEVATDGHWPLHATLSELDQLLTLEPRVELDTVIVTGTQHHLPKGVRAGTAATLTAEQLEVVPALGGDSMRIVNNLPGMSSVGVSANPLVRGGLPDETLMRIDGVELIEPFHLADFQSVFSAVDDRMVESIDVYTGGFPARYGNRMSGVMEMSTQERPRTERTEIGLSMFALTANARRQSDDGSSWWLLSARRGNLDLMVDRIDSRSGSPKYWDAYATVGRRFADDLEGTFGLLGSRDDVVFSDDEERARSEIDNRYAWVRLDHGRGTAVRGSTIAAFANSTRRKNQFSPDLDEDADGFLDYERDTARVSLRSDWSVDRGGTLAEFGAALEYGESDYDAVGRVQRGIMGELLGRPATEILDIRTHVEGPTWGLHGSVDLPLTDRLSVQPGLRADAQGYGSRSEKVYVSPRLGLEWWVNDQLTARLAAGRFLQPEAIYELQVTDGVDRFHAVQRANHYLLALEWEQANWTLRADGYYKDYENPKPRFENIFDPFVILPELEPDRVAISPSGARARGIDLEARRVFENGWTAAIMLSHLDAEDRIDGQWVPRRWSQRYTARTLAAWQNDHTQFAVTVTWHSGWRTTELPVFTAEPFEIAEILNNGELEDYVAVDLRLARTWRFGRNELTLYADLSNLLNRDNAAGIDYDVEEVEDGFVLSSDEETLLPFIPSIGFRLVF